ncbi:MAG: hypothetical protein WCL16_03225 [bacterium]
MKAKYSFALVSMLFVCGAVMAADPAAKPAVSEATLALLKEAQAIAKQNKPDESVAAYAKVLAADDLAPDQRVAAHMDLGRLLSAKGGTDAAAAEYEKALAVPGLSAVQKIKIMNTEAPMWFSSNFKGTWASYTTDGIDKAATLYRQIIEMPDASNENRIAACAALANCQLERMDVVGANATLDVALKLPDLKDTELLAARKNKADALYRELEFDQALPLYRAIGNEGRIVDILLRQKKVEEAEKLLVAGNPGPLRLANFYSENGKPEQAKKLFEEMVADKKNTIKDRSEAVLKLLAMVAQKKNYKQLAEVAEQYIPALIAEDPKAWDLYLKFLPGEWSILGRVDNDEYFAWVTGRVLASPRVTPGNYVKNSENLFAMHLRHHDLPGMRSVATNLLAAKDVPPPTRFQYQLYLAILDSNGREAGIVDKVNATIKAGDVKDDDMKGQAEALLVAAKAAMNMRYETVAKALYTARDKMLVQDERRSLPCTFIEKAPKDITGFLSSSYFKEKKNRGVLNRKYGDNVKFLLETDAALTGRNVTEKNADFVPTEFVATCDEDGIKLFFFATTAKAKDVADGLVGMGGYEAYLAAGADAPYNCYLIDMPPNGMNDDFVTQYNNKNFRRARQKENTAKIEHQMLDNGVATLLTVSWEAFFNAIPHNGDAWDFEPIHWEQGGYSWGGSQSVHNRSSFGSLVFANMTPANVNSIKRRLISKAVTAYRKELSAQNGYVEIWQDPELGDRPFYFEAVKPLQDKLGKYLEKVKPGMTNEDVELLYAEAVPSWMNIKYIVADLRRDYLDARRIAGK